ncbi:MAG: hypothetical protein ACTHOO_11315 [Alcanivorax sp.]
MNDHLNTEIDLPAPNEVAMIDVEASSLKGAMGGSHPPERLSYPIEVGVAHDDGHSQAYLIHPQPDWQDWNGESGNEDIGRIHGISRTALFEEGQDVKFVAEWLNEEMEGKIALCDSPNAKADTFWLNRLYEAAGIERSFEVHYLYDYMALDDPDMDAAYDASGIARQADHRAEQDAVDIMMLYSEYYAIKTDNGAALEPDVPEI